MTPTYDRFGLFGGTNFYSGTNNQSANIPAITDSTRSSTGLVADRTNGLTVQSSGAIATVFAGNSV